MSNDSTNAHKQKYGQVRKFFLESLKVETEECILWPFALLEGYGNMRYDGKMRRVHRLALELRVGKAPFANAMTIHEPVKCNNRKCFNYKHLRWGTNRENMIDAMIDKSIRGKLTPEQVREIKKDNRRMTVIAHEYGVTPPTIKDIRTGDSWSWLE